MTNIFCKGHARALILPFLFLEIATALAAPDLPVGSASDNPRTIRDFGAKGDGIADDTTAILLAIRTSGIAIIPPGLYRTTKQIKLSNGHGLTGDGVLNVDFDTRKPDTANSAVLVDGNDVFIRGIRLRKKFIDGSYGCGIVVASGHKNIAIRDVDVSGYSARYGIHIIEGEDFQVTGCAIHDFMMNTFADMIADSPAGIRITRSKHGIVNNNRLSRIEVGPKGQASVSPLKPGYGPQGYQADHIAVVQCSNISITGNMLQTSGEGIDLLLSRNCAVSGNVIADIWFQGIKMLGVSRSSITGNTISDCYQGIGLADHDSFGAPCFGNTVVGNTVLDTGSSGSFNVPAATRVRYSGTYGIDLHEACDQNVIANNVILDTQKEKTMKGAIYRGSGKHNIYSSNVTPDEQKP